MKLILFFIPLLQIGTLFGQNEAIMKVTVLKKGQSVRIDQIGTKDYLPATYPRKNKKTVKEDWILHPKVNPKALPLNGDPARQETFAIKIQKTSPQTKKIPGQNYSLVNPADPTLAVGPKHIVQMINGTDGSLVQIWDKSGNVLKPSFPLDALSQISGKGDPIVMYDHLLDRWLLTEIADNNVEGNKVVCLMSISPNPLGAYYVYSFETPFFPDYPKYGLWHDSYIMTSNEDDGQAVYAIDKMDMLEGKTDPSIFRFSMPKFETIGFQAATPVSLTGLRIDKVRKPMVMRLADDGWMGVSEDRLEIYKLNIDFSDSNNSSISPPQFISTAPFDTELCGFSGFSCIPQPNSQFKLDPLREVLMNRIYYREFDNRAAIVCSHVTDVTGQDQAGVRWYELRLDDNESWFINQQSTYAPDTLHRWMSTIGIDAFGSIGIAYNISSSDKFPSFSTTFRRACDPLNMMTQNEIELGEGLESNLSSRYGDYNDMAIDPLSDLLWSSGMYNPSSAWSTVLSFVSIQHTCSAVSIVDFDNDITLCDTLTIVEFNLSTNPVSSDTIWLSTFGNHSGLNIKIESGYLIGGGIANIEIGTGGVFKGSGYIGLRAAIDSINYIERNIRWYNPGNLLAESELCSPGHQSINEGANIEFVWKKNTNAEEYMVELYEKEDTTIHLILTQLVLDTSWLLNQILDPGSEYCWRVLAQNKCDTSSSTLFSFSTADVQEICLDYNNSEVALIDDRPGFTSSVIQIPIAGKVIDVNIDSLSIEHSFISDLYIDLTSPTGLKVPLVAFLCTAEDNLNLSFDDAANLNYANIPCPPTTGLTYIPLGRLSDFNSANSLGEWTIGIRDPYNFDGGQLNYWSLEVCIQRSVLDCVDTLLIDKPLYVDSSFTAGSLIVLSDSILQNARVYLTSGNSVELQANSYINTTSTLEIRLDTSLRCDQ